MRDQSRDPKAEAALGHASLLVAEVEEDLRELEREARAASPSSPGFDEDFVKEISTVAAIAAAEGVARAQMATVPDSDPPPVLSVALSPDRSVRVWDPRIAALALVLIAFVATAWLMR